MTLSTKIQDFFRQHNIALLKVSRAMLSGFGRCWDTIFLFSSFIVNCIQSCLTFPLNKNPTVSRYLSQSGYCFSKIRNPSDPSERVKCFKSPRFLTYPSCRFSESPRTRMSDPGLMGVSPICLTRKMPSNTQLNNFTINTKLGSLPHMNIMPMFTLSSSGCAIPGMSSMTSTRSSCGTRSEPHNC